MSFATNPPQLLLKISLSWTWISYGWPSPHEFVLVDVILKRDTSPVLLVPIKSLGVSACQCLENNADFNCLAGARAAILNTRVTTHCLCFAILGIEKQPCVSTIGMLAQKPQTDSHRSKFILELYLNPSIIPVVRGLK